MKNLIFLIFAVTLLSTLAYALPDLTTYSSSNTTSASFETRQTVILTSLDKIISTLNAAETKLLASPGLNATQKTTIQQSFDKLETSLQTYKAQIETATNLEELTAINLQIKQELAKNKDIIKNNSIMATTAAVQSAYNSAKEYAART